MKPRFRNVIFDLDGTLVDSRPGIMKSLRHTLERLGHALPDSLDLGWVIGPPLDEVMSRLLGSLGDDRVDTAVSHYRDHYGEVGLFDAQPYEGIAALLQALTCPERTLFVGTSKRTPFARTVLGHFGLSHHFGEIYGAEPHRSSNLKAVLVRHILDSERLDPAETVMVGDREHDVAGALSNGVAAISVTYGYGTREELRAAGATVFCDAPWQLRELL